MKEKKMLGLVLTEIIGLSIMTPPIYAQENVGQKSIGSNSGNEIRLNYNYIEITNTKDYIGEENTPITLDIGYAWDDMSWTYVKEVSKESTLTSNGFSEEETLETGYWYKGKYTENEFNNLDAEEKTTIQIPSVANNHSAITAENFDKTSKLIIHNYSNNNAYLFLTVGDGTYESRHNDELHGGFAVFDKVGENVSYNANLTAFSGTSGSEKTGTVTLTPSSTNLYGIVPMFSTSEEFESYSTNLTLNFTNAI